MASIISHNRSDKEWFELITECRQSGLSDARWCDLNGIPRSTFSTAAKRLREKSYALPDKASVTVNPYDFTSKQEVVKVDITRDNVPVKYDDVVSEVTSVSTSSSYLDNSHTIEIQLGDAVVKLKNDANPDLVKLIARSLMSGGCYAC